MLDQLRHSRDVITLESASGAMALESAVNRLPDFFSQVKSAFATFMSKPLNTLFKKRDITQIAQRVQGRSYTDLRSLEVYTPAGLKSDYLTYAEALSDAAKNMLSLREHVLQPFTAWLGQKLGNPASLASISTNLNITGYVPHHTDKLEKAIQACFHTTGKLEVTSHYSHVVKRNADWHALAKSVDYLNTAFGEVQHKEVVDMVNQCTQLMDQLMLRMQEEPGTYKLSPAAIHAIAKVSYDIGRELEFYGLLRHRIDEFSRAIADTAEKLGDVDRI